MELGELSEPHSMDALFDVVVLGAGVEGSSTAYHLARSGSNKVLLLEQFDALHTRGSSHGCSRVTRRAYVEPYYVKMMEEAFRLWAQIEEESGADLYTRTGILLFGPKSSSQLDSIASALSAHGAAHEVFSGSEANSRYPQQLNLPQDYKCVFEGDGGILRASKAVAVFQELFRKNGGVLLDNHMVTDIIPGHVITVVTTRATFNTKKLVVTAGAWAPSLTKKLGIQLPFKVFRAETLYWEANDPDLFSPKVFPTFGAYAAEVEGRPSFVYGLPIQEYPGLVKICPHGGPEIDPDHRDADRTASSAEKVSMFIKTFFKGVSTTPSISEMCMYTVTPDKNPILDRHPCYPNIIIGAGFSGHGFKLSPVMGKILSEMALDLSPSYDLTLFRMDRFNPQGDNWIHSMT